MSDDSFASAPPRILTEDDEPKLRAELARRLAEIDRGEVEMVSEEEMWRTVFGVVPPRLSRSSR